jgi:hypothetical protein
MKRIKCNRYIFRHGFGKAYEKVAGYDVEIVPWMTTLVAKNNNGGWTVFEVTTGRNIHCGKTIDLAIAAAQEYVANVVKAVGIEGAKKAIENAQKVPAEIG